MALAQELDRDSATPLPAQVDAPSAAELEATKMSQQGPIPPVATTGGAMATPSERAFSDPALDHGVHDWETYKAGKPGLWDDKYKIGHTSASQFIQPYEHGVDHCWKLKEGRSASQAVKDWVAGPTIADYRAASVGAELDEVRDDLGDQKFDKLFGSANGVEDSAVVAGNRLKISADMYTIPFADQMKQIALDADEREKQAAEQPLQATTEARVEEKPKAQPAEVTPIVVDELANHDERV